MTGGGAASSTSSRCSAYAIGQLNFLFDPAGQPHLTADQRAGYVGVVKSTMANKAALIRKTLNLGVFEPGLTRLAMIEGTRWPGSSRSTACSSTRAVYPPRCRTRLAGEG